MAHLRSGTHLSSELLRGGSSTTSEEVLMWQLKPAQIEMQTACESNTTDRANIVFFVMSKPCFDQHISLQMKPSSPSNLPCRHFLFFPRLIFIVPFQPSAKGMLGRIMTHGVARLTMMDYCLVEWWWILLQPYPQVDKLHVRFRNGPHVGAVESTLSPSHGGRQCDSFRGA